MSKEMFLFICRRVQPAMEKQATSFRLCVHLQQWAMVENEGMLFPGEPWDIGGHEMGYYILGDAAYPQMSWLMKPFMDNGRLTAQQHRFNSKISRARVVVENAFGKLKGRWRCLMKRNDCSTNMVKSIVITCCVQHNICETHGESFLEEWVVPAPLNQPDVPLPAAEDTGVAVRTALMHHLNV